MINLSVRGKGYYIFLQSFAVNSVLFLLGKFLDDNADFLFELVSNFLLYSHEMDSNYANELLIWNEVWFYVSGILGFLSSGNHLNIPYSINLIIGVSNAVSFFFIKNIYWLFLYSVPLGMFLLNNWGYQLPYDNPSIYDYLIWFNTFLLFFGCVPAAKFVFENLIYAENWINFANIIPQKCFIIEFGFYLWKILCILIEYEMYAGIILIFWLHVICGVVTFGDILYRKALSFNERNSKSELKRKKDIFKIIWIYFLIFIVLSTIPLSKVITIHIIGFSNYLLYYFLWSWQIGFILEFPDAYIDQFPQCFFMNIFGVIFNGFFTMKVIEFIFN